MNNNDVLRRLRYTFDLSDSKMIAIFGEADCEVTRAQISDWLKQDEDPAFQECSDLEFATFLAGFIIDRRGRRDGPPREIETRLTYNIIFRKIKIALDLKAEDVLALLKLADFTISKHELSAFFRNPQHKHYRVCQAQVLRKFLMGVQLKHRPRTEESPADSE